VQAFSPSGAASIIGSPSNGITAAPLSNYRPVIAYVPQIFPSVFITIDKANINILFPHKHS
jgi:hypothetical protein